MSRKTNRPQPRQRPRAAQAAPAAAGLFSRLVAGGIGAAAVVAMLAAPIIAAYFVVGLLPTAVAAVVDRRRPRYFAHTVGGLNVIGLWPYAVGAWKGSFTPADMYRMLFDPAVWLVVYGAAGLGWLLFYAMPVIAEIYLEIREDQQRSRLESRIAELKAEWGAEIASAAEQS
jgi:hypothetical protein